MPYKLLFILSFISFSIFAQVNLGADINTCEGNTITLDATTTGATQYQWFFNNTLLSGETQATLSVLQTGLYKTVVTANGNTYQDEINVTFNNLPVANYITVAECDDNTPDGFVSINITQYESSLTDNLVDNVVQFYLTLSDAENNTNALISPFTNTQAYSQELYVRVENTTTLCYAISTITIHVSTIPTSLNPFVLCETDGNGTEIFDLTSLQNGSNTYVFYETLNDAQNNTNAIATPNAYTNLTNPQTIFVSISNTLGCTGIATLDLQVFNQPVINPPTAIQACVTNPDGYVHFSFGSTDAEILGSLDPTMYTVSYHSSQDNANTGSAPYTSTFIDADTTFYVRVENNTTGCFATTTLDLVITQEQILTPIHLVVCDSDNDGFEVFDLTSKTAEILNSSTSTLSFYETYYNAQNGTNPIANPQAYTNTSLAQTIYARAEDAGGCISNIIHFQLRFSNPVINLPDVFMCFNETYVTLNPGFNPVLYDLVWTDDNNNTLSTANVLIVTQAGTYHLTVTETATNCTSTQTVHVETSQPFTVNTPNPIAVCINNSTGNALFDLTSVEADLGVSLNEFAITYHESIDYALAGVYSIPNPDAYESNLSNRTISIRVQSMEGCAVVVPLDIYAVSCADADNDGVADIDEDLNNNGNLYDDDTDMDGTPNYLDSDDDGDLVDTNIEINIVLNKILHPFVDTDNDLIENYLDNDDDGDGLLTINEDYNHNGNPSDDDTNANNIPDYLEASVTLHTSNFIASDFKVYPNPAKTVITINLSEYVSKNMHVSMYNLQGQIVKEVDLDAKTTSISLSGLKSGVYFLKFKNDAGSFTTKLLVE